MTDRQHDTKGLHGVVAALGETAIFQPGDRVRVTLRFPLGHYRVPLYLRGRIGVVDSLVQPAVDNEEEGFGRNAGMRRHYYRIAVPMTDIWHAYAGAARDRLYIEVFESWLEAVGHG
jgi:nitrile hydratase